MPTAFPFCLFTALFHSSRSHSTRPRSRLVKSSKLIGHKLLLTLAVCLLSLPALATPLPPVKPVQPSVIAIVDVPRILKESTSAKSIRKQIETHRLKFQTQIAKEEAELRGAEKELIKLREEGKKDAFVEMEQKLQARFMKVERHVQTRRKALDKAYTDSMNTVRKNLVETVAKLAKARSINMVVVKQQVIWNDEAIDLTEEVLKSLDSVLPRISIEIPTDDVINNKKPFVIKR